MPAQAAMTRPIQTEPVAIVAAKPAIAPMSIGRLYRTSPLGCVGIFLIGGVFSALLGMGSVWGTLIGLDVREVSAFVAATWTGGLLAQYPVGWLSDRMDLRVLVMGLAVLGTILTVAVIATDTTVWGYLAAAAMLRVREEA